MFPIDTAQSIAAQVVMGLAYMHSRGVVHGGALSLARLTHNRHH
jgi:hypothetical protein